MDFLIGKLVDIHPLGTDPDEAILSGSVILVSDIGFQLITNQGGVTNLTWETVNGYQITEDLDAPESTHDYAAALGIPNSED